MRREAMPRRFGAACLACCCAACLGGCATGTWNCGEPRAGWPEPQTDGVAAAIGIAVIATIDVALAIGAATVDLAKRALHDTDSALQPGIPYDSPEGRAIRIPHYPVR